MSSAQSAIKPSWSPDGTSVLFAEAPDFSRPTKWSVAEPNGQPAASLTAGDGLTITRQVNGGLLNKRTHPSPEWSASSRYIVALVR